MRSWKGAMATRRPSCRAVPSLFSLSGCLLCQVRTSRPSSHHARMHCASRTQARRRAAAAGGEQPEALLWVPSHQHGLSSWVTGFCRVQLTLTGTCQGPGRLHPQEPCGSWGSAPLRRWETEAPRHGVIAQVTMTVFGESHALSGATQNALYTSPPSIAGARR